VDNIASSSVSNFILDVNDPVPGATPLIIKATTTPASLIMSATDDSSLQMKIGLAPDLSDGSWETYSTATTTALATDPDTVYVQFQDAFTNVSSIQSVTTPETPINMIIRDITNLDTNEYQLFIAWKAVSLPSPGFQQYDVWYSTDGANYSVLTTISDRATNYYFHDNLASSSTYYYKTDTLDSNNNVSYYSSVINDQPDGQGGTDTTPPTISNVSVTATTTQSATIVWDTDELSNSTVGYSTVTTTFDTEVGVATMVDNAAGVGQHQVTITSLTPDTTYYFQVKSTDPEGVSATDNNGGSGYSFSTKPGPIISNVTPTYITITAPLLFGLLTWPVIQALFIPRIQI
jgi:hypothetical protein